MIPTADDLQAIVRADPARLGHRRLLRHAAGHRAGHRRLHLLCGGKARWHATRSVSASGAIEGVAAPEAANNAADQTAFIPTLMLGIPGSAAMAIMIAALMIQGIAPGPNIMTAAAGAVLGADHELLDRQPDAAGDGGAAGRHLGPDPDDPVPLALSGDPAVRLHRRLQRQQLDLRRLDGRGAGRPGLSDAAAPICRRRRCCSASCSGR